MHTLIGNLYRPITYYFLFSAFTKAINIFPIPDCDFKEYLIDFERIAKENDYITDNYSMEFGICVACGKKN